MVSLKVAAATALLTLGQVASEPAFGAKTEIVAPRPSHRLRDRRDKKRRKPIRGKKGGGKWLVRPGRREPSRRDDLRHDKYLHSHARSMRHLKWALENRGKDYPFDKPRYAPEPAYG